MKYRVKEINERWYVQARQTGFFWWLGGWTTLQFPGFSSSGFEFKETAKEMIQYLEKME